MKLILRSYFRSSASYRVRIGLSLKGLAFEYVPVHLVKEGGDQNKPAYRAEQNPMGQVPVLHVVEDDGTSARLTQSVAILEYLDERFPDPPLLPRDPLVRACVRTAVEIVNSGVQPLHNLGVLAEVKKLGGDEKAFAKAAVEKGLTALEAETERFGGVFTVGDAITLADVFLVPQLFAARRFGADLGLCPRLSEVEARLLATPAFEAAHPERQPDYAP